MKKIILVILIISNYYLNSATISGIVESENTPIGNIRISISKLNKENYSDNTGLYKFDDLKNGKYKIEFSGEGYNKIDTNIIIESNNDSIFIKTNLILKTYKTEDILVSNYSRNSKLVESPILTNEINSEMFKSIQSVSISEGLNFSPGLRFETDCGNCGFSQVRINGMQGSYSQILINSRPIYSSLTGIYGLEIIPANMIERVEITKGGGSVLYGGNAIAGTINIITKEPTFNKYEIANSSSLIDAQKLDNALTFNVSLVSNNLNSGVTFYGINRVRDSWDANLDGFSELPKIENTSFGLDGFYYVDTLSKLSYNIFSLNEERRGGNKFNLEPHQSDIAEYLDHKIYGTSITFEKKFKKTILSIYNSNQFTKRSSYYGAGGRIIDSLGNIGQNDLVALNAYGKSNDLISVTGLQFVNNFSKLNLIYGSELKYNLTNDEFKG